MPRPRRRAASASRPACRGRARRRRSGPRPGRWRARCRRCRGPGSGRWRRRGPSRRALPGWGRRRSGSPGPARPAAGRPSGPGSRRARRRRRGCPGRRRAAGCRRRGCPGASRGQHRVRTRQVGREDVVAEGLPAVLGPRHVVQRADGGDLGGDLAVGGRHDLRAVPEVDLVAVVARRVVAGGDLDTGDRAQVPDGEGQHGGGQRVRAAPPRAVPRRPSRPRCPGRSRRSCGARRSR